MRALWLAVYLWRTGRTRFVIVMADLIGIDSAGIRTKIADAVGLAPECVFVGDVHNHSSPISRPRPKGADPGRPSNEGTRWLRRFNRAVVRVARDALAAMRPIETPAIRIAGRTILLPRTYRELYEDFRRTAVEEPSTAVRIGDLTLVSFPGEMFHEIGRRVKHASPTATTFIAGYTNGSIGYFPTQAAFSEGGYEPAMSHLDPTAEGHYLRQVADLLAELV